MPISEEEKLKIKKRDLKTIQKYIHDQTLDPHVFDKTIEEIKNRYYEVSRALLEHRGNIKHPYFKYEPYNIEQEIVRKNNMEKIFARDKDQVDTEVKIIKDHHKYEAIIRKIEEEDERKMKLIAKIVGIKVPWAIPSQLIDFKKPVDPY